MVNRVTLIGNLGRDPEMRSLENGAKVARFSIATTESYKDNSGNWQDRTEWHSVIAWRSLAEQAERLFKKGSLVYIEGKLTTRKWQDQEGKDRYTTEVVANYMRLLNAREGGGSGRPSMPEDESNLVSANGVADDPGSGVDDDLPF
jgi:single-strand DNA-binding protein